MNKHDPLPPHAEALLRAPLPESEARPGFETRLLSNVREASPRPPLPLATLAGSICAVVLFGTLLALTIRVGKTPTTTAVDPPAARPTLEVSTLPNPLGAEAEAMQSAAARAGRFLLSHLPNLPETGESL